MPVPQPVSGPHRTRFYKTKMCRDWVARSWCPRDTQCRFAHGWEELRPHPDEAALTEQGCAEPALDAPAAPAGLALALAPMTTTMTNTGGGMTSDRVPWGELLAQPVVQELPLDWARSACT